MPTSFTPTQPGLHERAARLARWLLLGIGGLLLGLAAALLAHGFAWPMALLPGFAGGVSAVVALFRPPEQVVDLMRTFLEGE